MAGSTSSSRHGRWLAVKRTLADLGAATIVSDSSTRIGHHCRRHQEHETIGSAQTQSLLLTTAVNRQVALTGSVGWCFASQECDAVASASAIRPSTEPRLAAAPAQIARGGDGGISINWVYSWASRIPDACRALNGTPHAQHTPHPSRFSILSQPVSARLLTSMLTSSNESQTRDTAKKFG